MGEIAEIGRPENDRERLWPEVGSGEGFILCTPYIFPMVQDASLVVSAKDVKSFARLSVISELAPLKEKIRSLEKKYGCDLKTFEEKMKLSPEDFERWDDFIEWKAYSESVNELEARLEMIEDAEDVRVAPG